MDVRTSLQTHNPTMLPVSLLQRKCACGNHSAAAECEACGKKHSAMQRKSTEGGVPSELPPVVDEVLSAPGRPLDAVSRAFFEPRFSYDFSQVRIHTDARAAESASAVNALAYTVGRNVVFGAAQYEPHTESGKRLIAHELAHTVQQEGSSSGMPLKVGDPAGAPEREADRLADQVLAGKLARPLAVMPASERTISRIPIPDIGVPPTGPSSGRTSTTPTATTTQPRAPVPPRGTNPADCAESVCRLATAGTPTTDAEATRRVDDWARATTACVRADGPASNASHQAEIVANEVDEISADAAELRGALGQLGSGRNRYLDFLSMIGETCTRKAREIRIEFNYNVVFENPPGAVRWGSGDWDGVEKALSALPAEATWTNRLLVRFARAACHPNDLGPNGSCTGTPAGLGTTFVGGETDASTGRITIFNAGLGSSPISRSQSLGLSNTEQTLRHEVGHIIGSQISQDDQKRFFETILPWTDYSWAWITTPGSPHPNWQAERLKLRTELGFTEAQLDTWLGTLQPNVPVKVGDRTYTRTGLGGSTLFLSSVDASQLPTGVEFEYARTNRGEYIAELYALAVSRPEFLHSALPPRQSEWLKRVVFRIPATREEWSRQLAVANVPPDLFVRLQRVYTWEQAQPILDQIMSRQSTSGSRGGVSA